MSLKHLPLIALLVAPVAAQAAVNEMNEAALSEVHGQATVSGALFSYSVSAALNPDHWGGGFDLTTTPVVGGVQVTTKYQRVWLVEPTLDIRVTGKQSGNTYFSNSAETWWNPVELYWSNTATITPFR